MWLEACSLGGMAAFGWFSLKFAWWRPTVDWSHPRILMYHLVTPHAPGTRYRGMRVTPEAFEKQIKWLSDNEFTFATMDDLAAGPVRPKTVAITFDDGYADNHSAAFPILRKYRARATLYLVADREEGSDWSAKKKAHHNSGELVREPKLTDAQVREMVDSGVFALGAHTLTHANLSTLGPEEKHGEIAGSKTWLEERFGRPVRSFAYTFGIWDSADRSVVEAAGFTTAVTTNPGIDPLPFRDPLALSRIKVSGKEGFASFLLRLRTGRRGAWK